MNNIMDDVLKVAQQADQERDKAVNPEPDTFIIKDESGAIWAMEKYRESKIKASEVEDAADKLIKAKTDPVIRWRDAELKREQDNQAYFSNLLIQYYKSQKASNPKYRLSTPYGKLTERSYKKWDYDEETLLNWLSANNPELIRTKLEIDKVSLKKLYKDAVDEETGEVVEGISIQNEKTYTIKEEL